MHSITGQYLRESNLIEGFDDPEFDTVSFDAWDFLFQNRHCDLTERTICEVQKGVTKLQTNLIEGHRGQYRSINVTVGGRLCPPPGLVPELMNNWVLDMNENWMALDPKKMHVRFEKIHPFADGNGRTGRMLMWLHEIRIGKAPTLILNSEKASYYEWFS
mgnify:FL=1